MATPAQPNPLAAVFGPFGAAITQLTNVLKPLAAGLRLIPTAPPPLTPTAPPPGGSSGGPAVPVLGPVTAALAGLSVAAGAARDAIGQLTRNVALFNPGVVQQLNIAFNNLSATIGRAFVPLIQTTTQVVRQFTSIMAGVMATLAPVVRQVADTFGGIFLRGLDAAAGVFRSFVPVISVLSDVAALVTEGLSALANVVGTVFRGLFLVARTLYEMTGLGTVVRILTKALEAFNTAFRVVGEALSIVEVAVTSLVDGFVGMIADMMGLKNVMDSLNAAVQACIRSMYSFSIALAKFAGADGVVDALIASIERRATPGDVAAVAPQSKTLEAIARDLALAAAAAGMAGGQNNVRSEQQFWNQLLAEAKEQKANGASLKQIAQEVLDAVRMLLPRNAGGQQAAAPAGGVLGAGGLPAAAVIGGAVLNPGGALGAWWAGNR